MISLRGLDHVILRVRHPERPMAFYCDVLGCQVERQLAIGLIRATRRALSCRSRAGGERIRARRREGARGVTGHNMGHFCLQIVHLMASRFNAILPIMG